MSLNKLTFYLQISVLVLLTQIALFSQQSSPIGIIDSLETELSNQEGKKAVELLIEIAERSKELAPEKTIKYGNQALDMLETMDEPDLKAKALTSIATVYSNLGFFEHAAENLTQALAITEKLGNNDDIANSLNEFGQMYSRQKAFEKALEFFNRSLHIREQIKDKQGEAVSRNNIGNIYLSMGKLDDAKENYLISLDIKREIGDKAGIAKTLNNLGTIERLKGNSEEAMDFFRQAANVAEEIGDEKNLAYTYLEMGEYSVKLGRFGDALRYLEQAQELAQSNGLQEILRNAYYNLKEYYDARGQVGNELLYFERFTTLHDSIVNADAEAKDAVTQFIYGTDLQQKDQELSETKEQLDSVSLYTTIIIVVLLIVLAIIGFQFATIKRRTDSKVNRMKEDLGYMEGELKRFDEKLEQQVKEQSSWLQNELQKKKEVEEELKKKLEKAEESSEMKIAFLSKMGHEIRIPFNNIIGFANVLKEELVKYDDKSLFNYAELINNSAEKLLHLLNDIIDLSQIESNDIQLELKPVTISSIIRDTVEDFGKMADQKNIDLSLKITNVPEAIADEKRLQQVVSNIIRNAILMTDKGSVNIETGFDKESNHITVKVEDTGIGVSSDNLALLFEPFRKEVLGQARPFEGDALGLPIAKRLIKLMDGHIEANSIKNIGTTIQVSIPAVASEYTAPPKIESPKLPETESGETEKAAEKPNEGPQILVVEDDTTTQEFLNLILNKVGNVTIIGDGEKALDNLSEKADKNEFYDLVLLDIGLPAPLDGIKLLEEIRTRFPHYKDVPFIAQTAYATIKDKEKILKAGFDKYIAKPIHKKVLLDTVSQVLEA